METVFVTHRLALLNRGFIFAIAHVRGGGDLGNRWYEGGKLENKINSMNDFIACAEHLISERWTSKSQLAISGRSAGGCLMGAVLNMRPDLFKAALIVVPFVDTINTMFDPSIPWTTFEYEEWGDPNDETIYNAMKKYCPYSNITEQAYPHILVRAGLHDPRVSFWEPLKYVAKLRTFKTDENMLILHMANHGHLGPGGRLDTIRELAFEYAFLIVTLSPEGMFDVAPSYDMTTSTEADEPQQFPSLLHFVTRRPFRSRAQLSQWLSTSSYSS